MQFIETVQYRHEQWKSKERWFYFTVEKRIADTNSEPVGVVYRTGKRRAENTNTERGKRENEKKERR